MNISKSIRSYFLLLILSLALKSCIVDTMPLGYCVKNCTKDTLFVDLTSSSTLTDNIYWKVHPRNVLELLPEDTTSVYIHGEKVTLNNFYCVLPDSTTAGIYPLDNDTCYIYAIKKQIITQYTIKEIREQNLYDLQVVKKKDFHRHVFKYRPNESE